MNQEILQIINELPNVTNKLPHLEKIISSLVKMTKQEVQATLEHINITHIVECVSSEVDTTLQILQRFLEAVEAKDLLLKFEPLFIKGLASDDGTILCTCLAQLHRVASECPHCFSDHMNIFVMVLELLFADEMGSMSLVEDIIIIVGKHNVALFTCNEIVKCLEMVPAEKQLRFYDVIIKIAVTSDNCLSHFLSDGIFKRLEDIYISSVSDDPLLLLNCLELFGNIFVSPSALSHFSDKKFLLTIAKDMISSKDSPFNNILLPAFIKVFTTVGRTNFSMLISDHMDYFDVLNASCQNVADVGPCLVGLESFAILSQLPGPKEYLANPSKPTIQVDHWLEVLRTFLFRGGNDDIQAKSILICADLFTVPKHITPSKSYSDTNARWFNKIFDSRLDFIMQWAKSPLAERHVAAQRLLIALAIQPWAQQLMAGTTGFVDFLVNRDTEKDKMGRELKFELVQSIFMSPTTAQFFDGPDVIKVGVYVRQGPFFSTAQSVVGMEAE